MALLWPKTTRRRIGSGNKAFRLAVTPAGFVASAWPKKRGLPKDAYQKSILERMTKLVEAQRYMVGPEVNTLATALEKWNDKNVGNMGSATIRLRDLLTMIQSGRFAALLHPGGRRMYHVDALQDATRIVDWLEPRMGGMLVRTDHGWQTTVNCQPGKVMKLLDPETATDVCPPALPASMD